MRVPIVFAAALAAALLLAGSCSRPSNTDSPNLVIILSDALRASNLPFYGYPRATAPRLTELASESVVFEHHFANYPGTPISVSQLMTGRLTPPLMMSAGMAQQPLLAIEDDLLILPRLLREAGFVTGLVSSHHWFDGGARILDDFDAVYAVPSPDDHPYAPMSDLQSPVESFLDQCREDGRPFFLYIHSMDTHLPYRRHAGVPEPQGWGPAYDGYDHQILYTDQQAGRILDLLAGFERPTVVVLTSDHGEDLGEMGDGWSDQGHGNTLRRSQLHIPLVVRVPGVEPRRWNMPTRHVDVAPTLLGLLRADLPEGLRMDGIDLSSHLRAGTTAELPPSLAYTWRYWGFQFADRQAVYDQWSDGFTTARFAVDERNFPRPVPGPAEDDEGDLRRRLENAMRHEIRRHLEAPKIDGVTGPVGVPTMVLPGSVPPSYENDPTDDRWFLKTWMLLEAAAGEKPPPLEVQTPWVQGTYRVFVRLYPPGIERGFQNRFHLEVLGSSRDGGVAVDSAQANRFGFVDVGTHRIGSMLALRFSDPDGGVAVSGFFLVPEGDDAPTADPEQEKRLRALGYLE